MHEPETVMKWKQAVLNAGKQEVPTQHMNIETAVALLAALVALVHLVRHWNR